MILFCYQVTFFYIIFFALIFKYHTLFLLKLYRKIWRENLVSVHLWVQHEL